MVRIPVSRNRVSPQVTRDPGLVVDPAALGGPIRAAEQFGRAALGLARDISEIKDPADREKVIKRAAAQKKAASNRATAEGVRELISSRDSLEKTAPPGADGFEQMYGRTAEQSIARLAAERGGDDDHRMEITQALRQVGTRISEDARAFQAYRTVGDRRDAVFDLHDAFGEAIQRFPHMYDDLRRAGVAAVEGDDANFDADEQDELKRLFEARAASAVIAGWMGVDADAAEQELDSGLYEEFLVTHVNVARGAVTLQPRSIPAAAPEPEPGKKPAKSGCSPARKGG